MNVLKALYCNQYYELKPKGKEQAARTNGNRLLGISLSLNLIFLVVLVMVISPDFADAFGDLIKDIFGRKPARSVGKLVALIPFLIFLPLVQYTIGTQSSYDQTIRSFEQMSEADQKRVSKKGLIYFVLSMISLFVSAGLAMAFLS